MTGQVQATKNPIEKRSGPVTTAGEGSGAGPGCKMPSQQDILFTNQEKSNGCQAFTVKAPAMVPLWLSPLVTRALHGPVAAPAGIFTVQVIFLALATETFVAVNATEFFRSLTVGFGEATKPDPDKLVIVISLPRF